MIVRNEPEGSRFQIQVILGYQTCPSKLGIAIATPSHVFLQVIYSLGEGREMSHDLTGWLAREITWDAWILSLSHLCI